MNLKSNKVKADLYSNTGEKSGSIELPAQFFEAKASDGLVHEMLRLQLNNKRLGLAKVKARGERSGGGRKLRPQKGGGRSRQASTRSAAMRKGGRIFGPTGEQNYTISMPKKMRRRALFGSLSARANDGDIFALDGMAQTEIKTKTFADLIKKLPVDRNCLFVIPAKDETLEKSAHNLPNVKTVLVNYLNVHDILKYKKICFLKASVEKMAEVWKDVK